MGKKIFLFFLFLPVFLSAAFVGNPASPSLFPRGIFSPDEKKWSFRIGCLFENIYQTSYKEKFHRENSKISHFRLSTNGALLTFNLRNHFDFYALLGASRLRVLHESQTNSGFATGGGVKVLFFTFRNFSLGADVHYFQARMKDSFFLYEDQIVTPFQSFHAKYKEFQGALACAYQWEKFIPYIGFTFLHSEIGDFPSEGLIFLPGTHTLHDINSYLSVPQKKWGMVAGVSLIDGKQFSLTLETRMFDQNAVNVLGEFRF